MNKILKSVTALLSAMLMVINASGAQLKDARQVFHHLIKEIYIIEAQSLLPSADGALVEAVYNSYLLQTNPMVNIKFYGDLTQETEAMIRGGFVGSLVEKGVNPGHISLAVESKIADREDYLSIVVQESILN